MKMLKKYSLFLICLLAACQSVPPEPGMKLGKPYVVDGEIYYPKYDPDYDKTGDASWYGPGFHGKYTASGEIFNQNDLTAAHPTLPMPSLVRVTNLTNGKSLIVRINDRGPFKSHRIIDLSKESARRLGIKSITKVRIQFLKQETLAYLASMQQGGKRSIDMAQYNKDAAHASDSEVTEAAEPSPQIVENIEATSHAGQTIDDAAPVMTVSSADLAAPSTHNKTKSAPVILKEASANDDITPSIMNNSPNSNSPFSKSFATPKPYTSFVSATDAYLIQAGSFTAEENARKLASLLSGVAASAVDKTDMGEKSLWRVRLGPFSNKQSADDALLKVRAAGVQDAKIIHL